MPLGRGRRAIKYAELRRQYELAGAEQTTRHLTESLEAGHLKCEDFSIQEMFCALIEGGDELLRMISHRKSGGMQLVEAAQAVDTSAFSNITGQIIFNRILQGYENPAFLWPYLCETIPTTFLNGERIPGIGELGDKAEIVDEGQPYPMLGLNEEFIDTVVLRKRGFMVGVTREIIIGDRTGILLRRCGQGGYWLGLNKEKRVLDVTFGVVNNYKRNLTTTNTYLTSGAYVNQTANSLVDWTSIEKMELLFDDIKDPNTGEPVSIIPNTIIVPTALKHTANRILRATDVNQVDNQANAVTTRTSGPNPITNNYTVLSSPQVKARTGSTSTWFAGSPKEAFAYMEAWAIETLQAASNSEAEFAQDVMMRYKVSEMGAAQVLDPRRMTKNT